MTAPAIHLLVIKHHRNFTPYIHMYLIHSYLLGMYIATYIPTYYVAAHCSNTNMHGLNSNTIIIGPTNNSFFM